MLLENPRASSIVFYSHPITISLQFWIGLMKFSFVLVELAHKINIEFITLQSQFIGSIN